MEFLADAVAAGKVTAVGVSNYSAAQLRMAHAALAQRGVPLASNQVEYSLLHRQPESQRRAGRMPRVRGHVDRLSTAGEWAAHRQVCCGDPAERAAAVVAGVPGTGTGRDPAGGAAAAGDRGGYDKSSAQVALRWLIEREGVVPIPGAKNGQQASDNAGALTFSLTAAKWRRSITRR